MTSTLQGPRSRSLGIIMRIDMKNQIISTSLAIKVCAHCGRRIEPRRMSDWNWERLRYCSAACRRRAGARIHRDIEAAIVALLGERSPGASICPSEAARRLFSDRFSKYMEDVRRGARRLAARGYVVITQKGKPVDPTNFRGPIRIARGRRFH